MRYQVCLFIKGGICISEVVRAESTEQAIERSVSTKDIVQVNRAYAHPLNQRGPKPEDWRYDIRCSVTGLVAMSTKKPRRQAGSEMSSLQVGLSTT